VSKGVVRDLSSEMPEVPAGQHRLRWVMRVPLLRWQAKITAQSPDRSPAAVTAGWLGVGGVGLAPPAVLYLATRVTHLAWWSVPAAAAMAAVLIACETALMLWYQRRIRVQDLTETEGDPSGRADVLIEHQQVHGFELGTRKMAMTELIATSSPWSVPGLSMAFFTLVVAGIIPASAFVGLAALITGAAVASVISAGAVFTVTVAGGVITMITVERQNRAASPDPQPAP
jgi:hypothetical protein